MSPQYRHDNDATRKVVVTLNATSTGWSSAEVVLELPSTMTDGMLAAILQDSQIDLIACADWMDEDSANFQLHDDAGEWDYENLEEDDDAEVTARVIQDEGGRWVLKY